MWFPTRECASLTPDPVPTSLTSTGCGSPLENVPPSLQIMFLPASHLEDVVFTDVGQQLVPRRQGGCLSPFIHGADFATTGLYDLHDMDDELLTAPYENETEKTRQSWNDMSKGEYFKLIQLPSQTEESKSVEKKFKATLSSDVEIIKIERIQNQYLFDQYCRTKRHFDEKNPKLRNQRKLWHGTSSDSTNSINTTGFNRSYCGKNGEWFRES
ncbi:protein mono-ADP-ribosyltransferase PARP10-like [Gigantopelta aegis]|uniref:protein mono-ADP-ribosyltransferase PARP10-like n=1 Tax=Gigantopelta aegis TaxID=1735272 RepID=UPI001B88D3FE|nr:protein mono-ADP-ribosyltransferase PARP10-like [Gigantopelta aegis]